MSLTAQQVFEAAMALPHEDRVEVFTRLQESVGYFANTELKAEWDEEIARRLQELDEGRVDSIPAEEVYREIEEKYGVSFD